MSLESPSRIPCAGPLSRRGFMRVGLRPTVLVNNGRPIAKLTGRTA